MYCDVIEEGKKEEKEEEGSRGTRYRRTYRQTIPRMIGGPSTPSLRRCSWVFLGVTQLENIKIPDSGERCLPGTMTLKG